MGDLPVKEILLKYRKIESDIMTLQTLCANAETLTKRLLQKDVLDSWLLLLSDSERWVITTHLISGLPWAMVVIEFEKKWGKEQVRDERTLKRIQSKAIAKITCNIDLHGLSERIDEIFMDLL